MTEQNLQVRLALIFHGAEGCRGTVSGSWCPGLGFLASVAWWWPDWRAGWPGVPWAPCFLSRSAGRLCAGQVGSGMAWMSCQAVMMASAQGQVAAILRVFRLPPRVAPAVELVTVRPLAQQAVHLGDAGLLDPARAVRAARVRAGTVGAALADLALRTDGDRPCAPGNLADSGPLPPAQRPGPPRTRCSSSPRRRRALKRQARGGDDRAARAVPADQVP